MPGVQTEEVSHGWHEAGMCCARVPMRGEEKREESAEGRYHSIVLFSFFFFDFLSYFCEFEIHLRYHKTFYVILY